MRKLHVIVMFMVMLVIAIPIATFATPAQLSNTAQSKLDDIVSGASVDVANRLRTQIYTLRTLQANEQSWDGKIKELHYQNEEDLITVRKRIKLIDDAKLNKLDSEVRQTKARYKPLFDSYTALNQQIKFARTLKNKKLNSALRSQADVVKIAVQLARNNIRNKEDALRMAKASKANTVKSLRATLSDIDPLKVKIKSERSRMSKSRQRFTSEWKTLNAAIKNNNAKNVLNSLASLVNIASQVNEHMSSIHNNEKSMNAIIHKVNARIK